MVTFGNEGGHKTGDFLKHLIVQQYAWGHYNNAIWKYMRAEFILQSAAGPVKLPCIPWSLDSHTKPL